MSLAFVKTSGTLLSDDFCLRLSEPEFRHEALQPASFKTSSGRSIRPDRDMAAAYEILQEQWESIRLDIHEFDLSVLRRRWILPFLEILEYDPQYVRKDFIKSIGDDELRFRISHRGWDDLVAPAFHTVPFKTDLDRRPTRGISSPHSSVQEFLNHFDEYLWSFIFSGDKIRILRDYHQTLTKNYVEIDVEGLFETGSVQDFRVLYRLLHASRFVSDKDGKLPLERFHQSSHETGVEVGRALQQQVRQAIEILGNGFLDQNPELLQKVVDNEEGTRELYRELLHIIYRLLFLFFVEQKGWLPMKNRLYAETYSVSSLRDRALEGKHVGDRHGDLWEGLKITFRMAKGGVDFGEGEKVPAYGGQLFDDEKLNLVLNTGMTNESLLSAIEKLTTFERDKVIHRINFTQLEVDELGSVYEALLEYSPRVLSGSISIDNRTYASRSFFLDNRGLERKTTGSYYTDKRLVAELIGSALKPVIQDRMEKSKEDTEGKNVQEDALLSIKVCDPACGSGAFLIAAMETIAEELAKVRSGEEQPDELILRKARRDVLQNCIYGVDLNPMAVELCKVSLWIVAAMPDLPTNFLDHRVKCGNSLIGATGLLVNGNIPDDAFSAVTGDDPEFAKRLKKRNREERRSKQLQIQYEVKLLLESTEEVKRYLEISAMTENSPRAVQDKQAAYHKLEKDVAHQRKIDLYNLWTATFFWSLNKDNSRPPTFAEFAHYITDPGQIPPDHRLMARDMAKRHGFFHWELEFPDVFAAEITEDAQGQEATTENSQLTTRHPGFDVMLGNPPWERIKLQEKEWFASRDSNVALARNKAERARLIEALMESNPLLYKEFAFAKSVAEKQSVFVRKGGRFPLTGTGDINTYAIFAEHFRNCMNGEGRAGAVVPTGIATDDTTKAFFADIVERKNLASLYDFENREALFPSVHRSYKFCLLTFAGAIPEAQVSFFLTNPEQLKDGRRVFELTGDDFRRINPNTRTTPVFRTRIDAELTRKIYERVPVLVNEATGENPWGISFVRMFDMANDSHLFHTEPSEGRVPLYEAKMIWQCDHRFGTYEGVDSNSTSTHLPTPTPEQYENPDFAVTPRYWVDQEDVEQRLEDKWDKKWLIGFRDVTNATNERTAIFSPLPYVAVGHKIPLFFLHNVEEASHNLCFLSNFNGIILDFVARQKIGGTSLSYFILRQLPVLPLFSYSEVYVDFIAPRALELVYTVSDLEPFARDMGYDGPPFRWDEDRRALLKAELDAYYAKLYGLNRKQLRYILDPADLTALEMEDIIDPYEEVSNPLDEEGYRKRCEASTFPGETFRVLKGKEIRNYGEYRTRRLVLEAWEKLFR